jgi:short-subunit dehydrogenase involved in D-alanine esterification of teichoic acids
MGKLTGNVALITGGNSGIGLATAKRFVQEGAHVFISGRTQSELNEAVKQVGSDEELFDGIFDCNVKGGCSLPCKRHCP